MTYFRGKKKWLADTHSQLLDNLKEFITWQLPWILKISS